MSRAVIIFSIVLCSQLLATAPVLAAPPAKAAKPAAKTVTAPQPVITDPETALEQLAAQLHQKRVDSYQALGLQLEGAVSASAEARNLAVGALLQIAQPAASLKAQQTLQQMPY